MSIAVEDNIMGMMGGMMNNQTIWMNVAWPRRRDTAKVFSSVSSLKRCTRGEKTSLEIFIVSLQSYAARPKHFPNLLCVLYSTFKLIQAYGNPVGVLNAGRKRFPKSSARTSSWFL